MGDVNDESVCLTKLSLWLLVIVAAAVIVKIIDAPFIPPDGIFAVHSPTHSELERVGTTGIETSDPGAV